MNERLKPYRSFEALAAADKATLTADELMRYHRGMSIPTVIREQLVKDVAVMRQIVMETEKRIDAILDFLNGEPTNGAV